jgi:Homing endonuclease associated repeat
MSAFEVRRRPSSSRPARRRLGPTYTPDEILDAMRRWAARYGEPPTTADWEPARARRLGADWRAERFESGEWPSARMVRGQFETFNAAIEAAGLRPRSAPSRLRPNFEDPRAILDALVEWTRRYGDVPTMADWDPTRARQLDQDWRIARYNQGDWPSARSVANHFGSFSRAIREAGLLPRPHSSQRDHRREQQAANRLAVAEGRARAVRDAGLETLAASLKLLATARQNGDPVAVHVALLEVAGSALAWAQVVGAET